MNGVWAESPPKPEFKETERAEYFGHCGLFVVRHVWITDECLHMRRRCTDFYSGLSETQAINLCAALGQEKPKRVELPGFKGATKE